MRGGVWPALGFLDSRDSEVGAQGSSSDSKVEAQDSPRDRGVEAQVQPQGQQGGG